MDKLASSFHLSLALQLIFILYHIFQDIVPMMTINTIQDTDRKYLHNLNEIDLGQQPTQPSNSCLKMLSQPLQLTLGQLYQLNNPNNRNDLLISCISLN